jgi:DNA repair exonuclease SbcCD nuclease subunit
MIAFVGDAHLSQSLYAHRPLIKGDAGRALKAVQEKLLGMDNLEAVVLAGDTFDSRHPTSTDMLDLSVFCGHFCGKGIPVLSIQGNHDSCAFPWSCLAGGISLHGTTRRVGDLLISGYDYSQGTQRARMHEWMQSLDTDILVLHQSLSILDPFDPCCIDPEDIPEGVRLGLVCGHLHTPIVHFSSVGKFACSPGSTHARSFAEPSGSFLVVEDGKPRLVQIEGNRKRIRMSALNAEAVDCVAAALKDMEESDPDLRPLLEVKCAPEALSALQALAERESGKAHFFCPVCSPEETVGDMTLEATSFSREDILQKFVELGSFEHDYLTCVLDQGDTESLLDDARARMLERSERQEKQDMENWRT